jgi:hypothetical protein
MPAPYPFILTIAALVIVVVVVIYVASKFDDSETPETPRSGSTPGQKCRYCECNEWELKRPVSKGTRLIAGILTSFVTTSFLDAEWKVCKKCGKRWPSQK